MLENSELFKTLRRKYVIEWTTGKDLKIICTIWQDRYLKGQGVSKTSFLDALEKAEQDLLSKQG